MDLLISSIAILFVVGLCYLIFIHIPVSMARWRDRNALVWVAVSVILSPVIAIPALWLLGDAH